VQQAAEGPTEGPQLCQQGRRLAQLHAGLLRCSSAVSLAGAPYLLGGGSCWRGLRAACCGAFPPAQLQSSRPFVAACMYVPPSTLHTILPPVPPPPPVPPWYRSRAGPPAEPGGGTCSGTHRSRARPVHGAALRRPGPAVRLLRAAVGG
jgi:hypothetical protein